jgi:hypothetical protein
MKLRLVAAVAVLVSAGVHLRLWSTGVRHEHMVGPAFMLNAVAGIVIAILLVGWRTWLPPFLAAGFGVATLAAFIVSATVGLYGVHEHWRGSYVWAAAVAEAVAILAGGWLFLTAWRAGEVSARASGLHRGRHPHGVAG